MVIAGMDNVVYDNCDDDVKKRKSSRLCHRFLVKSAGIVAFFVVASLHSWIQGGGGGGGEGARQERVRGTGKYAQGRILLEEVDRGTEVVADDSNMHCAGVARQLPALQCEMAHIYCAEDSGRSMVNYIVLHYCGLGGKPWISVPVLVVVLILAFYILAETAENYFSPVVRRLVEILGMTPSMGGVTLLALGNGAPDIFASLAAIGGDNSRIGFSAILSAGTFVSAVVVGSVALAAAPFPVLPMPFVRDVSFYFGAVCLLFIIYLQGEVVFWQAVSMISFYVLFVVVVICTDQKGLDPLNSKSSKLEDVTEIDPGREQKNTSDGKKDDKESQQEIFHVEDITEKQVHEGMVTVVVSCSQNRMPMAVETAYDSPQGLVGRYWDSLTSPMRSLQGCMQMQEVTMMLHLPASVVLKSTIPEIDPSKWSRKYGTANVVLCPLLILYMFTSVVSLNRHIIFLAPSLRLPIWVLVLLQGFFMGAAYHLAVKRPPASGEYLAVGVAFVMSVFWISVIAGELLGCLVTLGIILGVSPALLGLTVLAWGNSIGDLVADVAVARVGQPAMAVAGCFAGPMFNMLVGLGAALCLRTAKDFPVGYQLDHHPGILVAFGFLSMNLLGTLSFVISSKFQLTRFWGKCLISWYVLFMVVSVIVAQMVSVQKKT